MSFRDVCELISGAVPGALPTAVSRLDDSGSSASEALFAWVHAELVERDVDLDDDGTEAVRRIVALATLAQRHCDAQMWAPESGAEAAVTRLIKAIEAIAPHISTLHMRIIEHGDERARECLSALVGAAEEMTDNVCQQDFMVPGRYRVPFPGEAGPGKQSLADEETAP